MEFEKAIVWTKGEYDEDEIKRFFSLYSRMTYSSFMTRFDLWHPLTDFYETDDELIVICDIAGIKKENLRVFLNGNKLYIKGERENNIPPGSVIFHDIEILYGPFEREISLPENIQIGDTKAIYKDGFLRIHLKKGKSTQKQEKSINIE